MQLNSFYTGSKVVGAIPMSHDDFCRYVGRDIDPEALDLTGYLVEYLDGGKANHPGHVGYISWSPSEVFEKNYISIGDITGLAPFIIRLKAERAENYDRLQKLRSFLDIQDEKTRDEPRTDERQAFLDKIPTLDIQHLALQQEQLRLMQGLEEVLTQRLELLVPEARVEHKASIRFSVANGTRFDIMPRVFKALEGQIDACCYTGTIYNIPVNSIKVFGQNGDQLDDATVRVEKMVRGFGISGDIGEELLFDIGMDVQRGITHVTSSFSEDFQIEIEVQLADINRRLV
jgi:hypothetical protein